MKKAQKRRTRQENGGAVCHLRRGLEQLRSQAALGKFGLRYAKRNKQRNRGLCPELRGPTTGRRGHGALAGGSRVTASSWSLSGKQALS